MSAIRTVVLVGGGHTHVQVLRRWAMDPPKDLRLLVVLDRPVAVYSGMVPGYVAGDYARHELEIDVVPLARRAKAGVILAPATDLDPVRKEISVDGRPPIRFDLASLDVGSTVRGLDLPGVSKHTLATRPIGRFVGELDARLEAFDRLGRAPRILIVGGGAAGTELAFCIDARLRRAGVVPSIATLTTDPQLLANASVRTRAAIEREARERGIETLPRCRVVRADASGIVVAAARPDRTDAGPPEETELPADLVVWATGAAPIAFPEDRSTSALARDAEGFIEVRDTLQTVGFDDVFAAGDCARTVDHPWVPRAGVYAVRQGPILEHNLRARLEGSALKSYRPQRDFLSLLNLGQGRALGSKWGMATAGAPVFRLKDWIDRRFMSRFQVLDEAGRPRPELARLGAMASGNATEDEAEMACGGCAAKLAAEPLAAALDRLPTPRADESVIVGLAERDDVAVTRDVRSGTTTLHNVDVIRSFCDDPWLVGKIAASNATSDLFAKGGRPRHAQAIIGLPDGAPEEGQEILFQALAGIRAVLDEIDVSLIGGHTTIGEELTIGLSVTGEGPEDEALMRQSGARAGDLLLLTGPIGTGVVLAADQMGLARGEWIQAAHAAMSATNDLAGRVAQVAGAHAATDVTGFGFAGHLLSLLEPNDLVAELDATSMPRLPGARLLWSEGIRSTAHPANRSAFEARVEGAGESDEAWLFDPQTSGPLLLAVAPDRLAATIDAFTNAGHAPITRVGRVVERGSGANARGRHRGRIEIARASDADA